MAESWRQISKKNGWETQSDSGSPFSWKKTLKKAAKLFSLLLPPCRLRHPSLGWRQWPLRRKKSCSLQKRKPPCEEALRLSLSWRNWHFAWNRRGAWKLHAASLKRKLSKKKEERRLSCIFKTKRKNEAPEGENEEERPAEEKWKRGKKKKSGWRRNGKGRAEENKEEMKSRRRKIWKTTSKPSIYLWERLK